MQHYKVQSWLILFAAEASQMAVEVIQPHNVIDYESVVDSSDLMFLFIYVADCNGDY